MTSERYSGKNCSFKIQFFKFETNANLVLSLSFDSTFFVDIFNKLLFFTYQIMLQMFSFC